MTRYGFIVILMAMSCAVGMAQTPVPKFEAQSIDDAIEIGYGLAIGDVDGDKKPDILLADKKEFVWYRNGDWEKFTLAKNLTAKDNVCIAARDLDGDGRVEIAVGGNWNPGETGDAGQSGSLHYLIRPSDATDPWNVYKITPHDPTVHRMHWVQLGPKSFALAVLPLHGIDNKNGEGAGVAVRLYRKPDQVESDWENWVINRELHKTHNFDVVQLDDDPEEEMLVGSAEGLYLLDRRVEKDWTSRMLVPPLRGGAGEVRFGNLKIQPRYAVSIEPMHGNFVVVYHRPTEIGGQKPMVQLTDNLSQGHALATGDLLGIGRDQVVAGWRNPDGMKKVGIRIFVPTNVEMTQWKEFPIDDNTMACEDLKLADMDGDGKLDVIACGRATKNVVIYWNKSGGQ